MKKLLVGLVATFSLLGGVAFGSQELSCAKAEVGSSAEVIESASAEDVVSEFIENFKAVCEQPIVIAGVSTTLGALVLFVISKFFTSGVVKKLKEEVADLKEKAKDTTKDEQIAYLTKTTKELVDICKLLTEGCKNINIKEKANKLLEEVAPIKDKTVEFVKEESKKVVDDTKEFVRDEIAEILDK